LTHLLQVFTILQKHVLFAKFSKCSFGKTEIEYLGHVVSKRGVRVDESKIEAVKQWPTPTSVKQLRAFLGLASYYRQFIHRFALLVAPLTDLLRKDNFAWSTQAQQAFLTLKIALSTAPVLALPDFSKPFILETDASGTGITAILSQEGHPLAYFSKKLSPTAQKQSVYAKEMLTIISAVAKFRHYLLGHKFIIRTDHRSLKEMQVQTIQTPEQQMWLAKLLGYDFTIEYKKGCENNGADGLSRSFLTLTTVNCALLSQLHEELKQYDPQGDFTELERQSGKLQQRQGLWYWANRIIIPRNSNTIKAILQEFHDSILGGHGGYQKTLARITAQFFWKDMAKSIKVYVKVCQICQQAKYYTLPPAGLLQPLLIPTHIWQDISMDFITGLPVVHCYSMILVVVDRLSKFAHFIPLPPDFNTPKVAEVFIKQVVSIHGLPQSIVSDRDKIITSKFWKQCCKG